MYLPHMTLGMTGLGVRRASGFMRRMTGAHHELDLNKVELYLEHVKSQPCMLR